MPLRHLFIMSWIILTLVACAEAQNPTPWRQLAVTGVRKSIEHDGRERSYRVHVPQQVEKRQVPLVVFLHGGGGDADQASRMGMTDVADRHGFVVVYPEAIDKHWNDGRESERFRAHDRQIDDVAFIAFLVDELSRELNIDRSRIFAAGASNGGFMSQRLAIDKPQLFAAVGVMIATMAEPLSIEFYPRLPVSVLFMNGTADPFVPYEGGEVQVNLFPGLAERQPKRPSRGTCISTDDAVRLWLKRNGLGDKEPVITMIPDKNKDDDSQIEFSLWTASGTNTSVALYRVVGGGHTIPGGVPYLPTRIIGNTNQDLDSLEAVWQFFKTYGRR